MKSQPLAPANSQRAANNGMGDFELSDLDPLAKCHTPQTTAAIETYGPPSPLITFAPNSPPVSPILSASSSFEDLTSIIEAYPASPPQFPPLAVTSGFTTHNMTSMPVNDAPRRHDSASIHPYQTPPLSKVCKMEHTETSASRILKLPVKASLHPAPAFGPLIDIDLEAGHCNRHLRSIIDVDEDNEDYDMPLGYPYRDWLDYRYLALEWLRALQRSLSGFMETNVRGAGARHTV
ncbi:MAG: hypothetical protein Q9218_007101 [Villophora microphyllina]